MKKTYFIILISIFFTACDNGPEIIVELTRIDEVDITTLSREDGQAHLNLWYGQIQSGINSIPCKSANDLKIVPIGAKGCGGPTDYIAYPKNETAFFTHVEKYTETQKIYNKKWGVVSDCSVPQPPKSAECVNGKITLIY
jgi:hypothetical protein